MGSFEIPGFTDTLRLSADPSYYLGTCDPNREPTMARYDQLDILHSDFLYRMGQATLIVASGTNRNDDHLGEYHILLPRGGCDLVGYKMSSRETAVENVEKTLENDGWTFHGEVTKLAIHRLERMYLDNLLEGDQSPPHDLSVEFEKGEKLDLTRMSFRGECRDALEAIRNTTQFGNLKSHLSAALSFEPITVERLGGDD